jgi:hypothetical protein
MATLTVMPPNAGGEPPPKAGARYERALEAVACMPLFGLGYSPLAFRLSIAPGKDR